MARTTPSVRGGYLEWRADEGMRRIALGTPEWFAWLDQHTTFAYITAQGSLTVRRDRGQRGGWYWRAYHRREGRLCRAYLGAAATITLERLENAAAALLGPERVQPADNSGVGSTSDEDAVAGETGPGALLPGRVPAGLPDHPFLAARVRPPEAGRQLLERPTLLNRLDHATQGRLSVLVAPSGFGKTTLLAQWYHVARQRGQPVAWLSIEPHDNDPLVFWGAMLVSLRAVYPGFAQRVAASLTHPTSRRADPAVVELLNALAAIPHDLTLVLDDYHLITEPLVHAGVADLLARLPRNIHVLLATRTQPPWPLGRMRARGELVELRAAELCLSPDEVAVFLRELLLLDLPEARVADVAALTEGWIGGLQLAAQALRDQPQTAPECLPLSGDHHELVTFFGEEVLQGLPQATQTFLCESAILDRLNGPLCQAVTGEPASNLLLESLARNHLFLTPLDNERRWYRYHPLFSSFLREQLARRAPERRTMLYQAAVAWFEQTGLVTEAIAHALAGGLTADVVQLLERYGDRLLLCGELRTLRRWLDMLPETLLSAHPRLLLLHLAALILDARWDCVEPLLRGLAPLKASDSKPEWPILQALAALMMGQGPAAEAALTGARPLANPEDRFVQHMLTLLDGASAWMRGEQHLAQTLLAQLEVPGLAGSGRHIALLAIAHQAHFDMVAGRLETALLRYQQVYTQADPDTAGATAALGMAALGLAQVHYERNQLEAALSAASRAVDLAQHWDNQGLGVMAALVRVQMLIARGELSDATRVANDLEAALRQGPALPGELCCLALARAELALAREEAAVAASWLDGVSFELQRLPPGSLRERAQRIQVRVLLLRGEVAQALQLLQPLMQEARERGRVNSLIPLLALMASAAELLGQRRQARQLLEQLIRLGAAGPFVRSVVEAGPLPNHALADLPALSQEEQRYVALLRVAAMQQERLALLAQDHQGDPLSPRERVVLQLAAAGASNRDIAAQLIVTESTVKKYLSSAYQKLGAARRTQAIAEARARGLL